MNTVAMCGTPALSDLNYTAITRDGLQIYTIEDAESFFPCAMCNKVFSSELEGSTDKPDLCDKCWCEVTL